jgi:hypothetical protein
MKISDLEIYKVVELDHLIAIVGYNVKIAQGGAELMAGPMPAVCEYLARYTYERAGGKDIDAAHKSALIGAKVVQSRNDLFKG